MNISLALLALFCAMLQVEIGHLERVENKIRRQATVRQYAGLRPDAPPVNMKTVDLEVPDYPLSLRRWFALWQAPWSSTIPVFAPVQFSKFESWQGLDEEVGPSPVEKAQEARYRERQARGRTLPEADVDRLLATVRQPPHVRAQLRLVLLDGKKVADAALACGKTYAAIRQLAKRCRQQVPPQTERLPSVPKELAFDRVQFSGRYVNKPWQQSAT